MAGRSYAACIVNPMATWGDRGRFEGIDDDTIGERGTESHKALHVRRVVRHRQEAKAAYVPEVCFGNKGDNMIGDFYGDGNRYRGVLMSDPSVMTITICETIIIEPADEE